MSCSTCFEARDLHHSLTTQVRMLGDGSANLFDKQGDSVVMEKVEEQDIRQPEAQEISSSELLGRDVVSSAQTTDKSIDADKLRESTKCDFVARREKSIANLQQHKSCPLCGQVYGNKMGGKPGGSQCIRLVPVTNDKGIAVCDEEGNPILQRCPYVFRSNKQKHREFLGSAYSPTIKDSTSQQPKKLQKLESSFSASLKKVYARLVYPACTSGKCKEKQPV
uniref:Uncharacterized protein n=1 Tax=Tetraselmis sp. GSL018 TaxID=582737 RepID=A0A061SJ27_9CHLO|mmetsp:Transcript_33960/g.80626  ORF Transcript_33960/g.80626 Transcript_33960/m.80626 type:complete len:222 (-) Transcript_33960:104-769(-)|eukprot:CAMPEP_0177585520 /NCGR_PEP_ID=MMETSP0419_2-20121207/4540_1 /TAXON_ID=582737 /ORGANISM="Tetraselmis sp., Strain GSL018" /LENGTH=221 /DNA_ID=CAMNT_0019075265 /DNA_START=318 /DNA_END=983 /DNA_ORIENTATION=-